eukprot:12652328-Heterocapsa_arctica.AAC.1
MINQGQLTSRGPKTSERGTQDDRAQAADASTGGETVYHDISAGDDDATMDAEPVPHYEDLAAEVERLRAQAEAEVMASANRER